MKIPAWELFVERTTVGFVICHLEQFLSVSVVGNSLLLWSFFTSLYDWLVNLGVLSPPMRSKAKAIMTWSSAFSRHWRQLGMIVSFWLVKVITLGLGLQHLVKNHPKWKLLRKFSCFSRKLVWYCFPSSVVLWQPLHHSILLVLSTLPNQISYDLFRSDNERTELF